MNCIVLGCGECGNVSHMPLSAMFVQPLLMSRHLLLLVYRMVGAWVCGFCFYFCCVCFLLGQSEMWSLAYLRAKLMINQS